MIKSIFKNNKSRWKKCLVALLGLGAAIQMEAQFFPGGGGGGGNLGGGNTGGNRTRSTSATRYPGNSSVGDAYFTIDQDARKVVVIADPVTLAHISEVISNLDRPQPQ